MWYTRIIIKKGISNMRDEHGHEDDDMDFSFGTLIKVIDEGNDVRYVYEHGMKVTKKEQKSCVD
jgi:hypothetical protein